MAGGLTERSLRALLWSAGDSFGQVALSFATFFVLVRMLEPADFGIVALAGVFIFFFGPIANLGFTEALVQRQQIDSEHFNTSFWCSLGISLALMSACFLGADALARLLGEPAFAPVLQWLSLTLPLNALGGVQLAFLRRDIRFRELSMRSLAGRAAGSIVGIAAAVAGMGVWSLVAQQLVGALIKSLAVALATPWRPKPRVSLRHFRELWGFGFHTTSSQIVLAASEQLLTLLIGWLVGSVALGYFTVGLRMVELIRSVIANAVQNVAFAAFSRLQDDLPALQRAYRQATRISCLFGFPIGAGMIVLAEPLVTTLFGAKWAESIPLFQILATGMFFSFYTMFVSSLHRALGRADIGLYLSIAVLVLGVVGVGIANRWGLVAIAMVWVGRLFVILPAIVLLLRWLLRERIRGLLQPAAAPLAASGLMTAGMAVMVWQFGGTVPDIALIPVATALGAVLYGLALWSLSPDLMRHTIKTLRTAIHPTGGR